MKSISPSLGFTKKLLLLSIYATVFNKLLRCMHGYGKEIIAVTARQQVRRYNFMWQCELVFKVITFEFGLKPKLIQGSHYKSMP